jgi:extracellular factor (EF) 3-hydroxypalmitic acid methyl ester biosynthesis protein
MENKPITSFGERDSFVLCRNSQGIEVRATLLRLTRYLVVFEVYNPYSILQLSEVLSDFRIVMNDRLVYSGRAVVSNLVNTGIVLICETTLDEGWLDVDLFVTVKNPQKLHREFGEFLQEWEKVHRVIPEFKVVVADMQMLLMDLRRWFEQLELAIRSQPTGDRLQMERELIQELQQPIFPAVGSLFERFELIARNIQEDLQPVHRSYIKRQIHPLVLCSPFLHRTYQKPLGYAGDYEMVNMMMRDPYEGSSLFAKMLNLWILSQPSVQAHRNRIDYLTAKLTEETQRVARQGRIAQIFNLGCGPAKEVQNFLIQQDLCERAHLTLLDFNDETLMHAGRILEDLKMRHRRVTPIMMVKKSVHQVLKEGTKMSTTGSSEKKYDFLYCAGLFDYLSDRICKRMMTIFYEALAPGGLLIATNVDPANPIRSVLEYIMEWHLVYRDGKQLKSVCPEQADPDQITLRYDPTGINVFLEVRKPG